MGEAYYALDEEDVARLQELLTEYEAGRLSIAPFDGDYTKPLSKAPVESYIGITTTFTAPYDWGGVLMTAFGADDLLHAVGYTLDAYNPWDESIPCGEVVVLNRDPYSGYHVMQRSQGVGFWAKITGHLSGAAYTWVQQVPGSGGSFSTPAAPRQGVDSNHAAYEVNGATSVATNTIVWMRNAVATCGSGGDVQSESWVFTSPPAPFNLKVMLDSGSPAFSNISVIEFNQNNFTLSSPSAGAVDVGWTAPTGSMSSTPIVTSVTCSAGTLSVTTGTLHFPAGLGISVT